MKTRQRLPTRARFAGVAAASLLTLAGSAARAQPSEPSPQAPPTQEGAPRRDLWQLGLGARLTRVTHAGFDPYADDDALGQVSVMASRSVWSRGRVSLMPGIAWDYGERSASARAQSAKLRSHRLALSLEGRYELVPGLYATARLAAGALHQSAEIADGGFVPYVARGWAPTAEASVGGVVLLGRLSDASQRVRFWVGGDAGYVYTPAQAMVLHADLPPDDPRRAGDLDLGPVALRGGFGRLYVALTF